MGKNAHGIRPALYCIERMNIQMRIVKTKTYEEMSAVAAGIIGGLLAWPVAVFLMGKAAGDIAFYAYIVPFLVSTVGGSIIAGVVLIALEKNSTLKKMQASLAR